MLGYLPSIVGRGYAIRSSPDRLTISDVAGRRQIWLSRANAVYAHDVVTSFDYYFSAVEPFEQPTSAGGWRVVDYSSPRIHRVPGFPDFPVMFPSLAEPYQTCEQYLEFAQLRAGQTVLDLGCYAGLTAVAFSKAVTGSGRVISAEPDPVNFAVTAKNLDLHRRVNALGNIQVLPVAISDSEGTLAFSSEGSMGSSAVAIVGGYRGRVTEVPCVTLEGLLARGGGDRVDFIKMDIEGAERAVIRGAGAFLRKHRPRIIIEPHVIEGNLTADEVVANLTSYGYRCAIIKQFGVALPLVTAIPEPQPA